MIHPPAQSADTDGQLGLALARGRETDLVFAGSAHLGQRVHLIVSQMLYFVGDAEPVRFGRGPCRGGLCERGKRTSAV